MVATGSEFAHGLAVELSGDLVATAPHSGEVTRIDPGTGAQTLITSFSRGLFGIAIEDDGSLLVAIQSLSTIARIDPVSGAQTVVSSGGLFVSPSGIAVVVPEPSTGVLHGLVLTLFGVAQGIRAWGTRCDRPRSQREFATR